MHEQTSKQNSGKLLICLSSRLQLKTKVNAEEYHKHLPRDIAPDTSIIWKVVAVSCTLRAIEKRNTIVVKD